MTTKILKRSIFQRIFGISATKSPQNEDCWTYSAGKITINLGQSPELSQKGGAIRLEGRNLPKKVLVIHGDDGNYHAFCNRCGHAGRRLDPVPDTQTVQCCSIGKATYNYDGKILSGPAKEPVSPYQTQVENGNLIVTLSGD